MFWSNVVDRINAILRYYAYDIAIVIHKHFIVHITSKINKIVATLKKKFIVTENIINYVISFKRRGQLLCNDSVHLVYYKSLTSFINRSRYLISIFLTKCVFYFTGMMSRL